MIYGYSVTINGKIATLVVSADDIDELNAWVADVAKLSDKFNEHNKPGFMDYMQDEFLKGLKDFCHTFTHDDIVQQQEFFAEAGIEVLHSSHALDYQLDMISTQKVKENPDMTPEEWMSEHGETSITEIYGLSEDNDKWDRRDEKDKQKDKMEINKAGQMASEGKLTMPSFIPQKETEDTEGLNITNASVQGGLVTVSATKGDKKKGIAIQLSPEVTKELAGLQSKVSKEIYHEKHKAAVAKAGLEQSGLNDAEVTRVLTEITNARGDLLQLINEIQNGTFDKEKYSDAKLIKDATAGDDYARTDLAERSVNVVQNLRENGFSDELANHLLAAVDPSSCPTQEAYIEAIEKVANEAIKDKNYRAELTKAQDENRPFAVKEDDFVNPFGDDNADEAASKSSLSAEDVAKALGGDVEQDETTKPQEFSMEDPLAPIKAVFGEPHVSELIVDLADSSGRTIETWKDGPKQGMMKLVEADGSVKVMKMNDSYVVEELVSVPAGSIDAKEYYDSLKEDTIGKALEAQFGGEPEVDANDDSSPVNYYFAIKTWEGMTCVAICPKAYWDKEKCLWDDHISVDCGGPLTLPAEFEEVEEAQFIFDGSENDARAACLILGMVEDPAFSKFMS